MFKVGTREGIEEKNKEEPFFFAKQQSVQLSPSICLHFPLNSSFQIQMAGEAWPNNGPTRRRHHFRVNRVRFPEELDVKRMLERRALTLDNVRYCLTRLLYNVRPYFVQMYAA